MVAYRDRVSGSLSESQTGPATNEDTWELLTLDTSRVHQSLQLAAAATQSPLQRNTSSLDSSAARDPALSKVGLTSSKVAGSQALYRRLYFGEYRKSRTMPGGRFTHLSDPLNKRWLSCRICCDEGSDHIEVCGRRLV